MRYEFKPGGLALVVQAHHPENIGKTVELLRFDDSEMIDHLPYADQYTENPGGKPCWLVLGEISVTRLVGEGVGPRTESTAAFLQAHLMPLRGDENPDASLATERPSELVSA